MNVIAGLEFELTYLEVSVRYLNDYAAGITPQHFFFKVQTMWNLQKNVYTKKSILVKKCFQMSNI